MARDNETQFSLGPDNWLLHLHDEDANDWLERDLTTYRGSILDLAITGKFYFLIATSGGHDYYNVPAAMSKVVNRWRNQPGSAPPIHVALGAQDQYVILFADNEFNIDGPEELREVLISHQGRVSCVALGSWGVWCVLEKDGSYHGSDLLSFCHAPLYNILERYKEKKQEAKPVQMSLGPHGEWFVMYEDGAWSCGGLSRTLTKVMVGAKRCNLQIERVMFGEHRSYYIGSP